MEEKEFKEVLLCEEDVMYLSNVLNVIQDYANMKNIDMIPEYWTVRGIINSYTKGVI